MIISKMLRSRITVPSLPITDKMVIKYCGLILTLLSFLYTQLLLLLELFFLLLHYVFQFLLHFSLIFLF